MASNFAERVAALNPIIEKICKASGVPGLSVGVSQHGNVLHQFNYGSSDIEGSVPTNSDTIYGIGSISKTFTATAIAQLVDDKKLQWNTPLKDILPGFHSRSSLVTNEATVEDLLTHRLALSRSNNWWYGSDGDLILEQNQTLSAYSQLKPMGLFRGHGQTYGEYISASIADPLGLQSTTAIHSSVPESNVAKPYAALDNLDFYQLPRPQAQSGTIMGPAQGALSSVNDLLKYASAMMSSAAATDSQTSELRGMQKQLAGHIFMAMSTRESSYGLGLFRHQLPGVISGTGANGMFVKQLPVLVPGGNIRLVISHPGSLAGYTSFFAMLPEIDVGVVVLTNSIGLADPSACIGHVLLEALVETPSPVDIMQFVEEAAQSHIQSYPKLQETFNSLRGNSTPPAALQDYVGVYQFDAGLDFKIVIRLKSQSVLQVVFQAMESQTWDLQFLEGETFHWLTSRDDQAKKAKFTYPFLPSLFKIVFERNDDGLVDHLIWKHDPAEAPEDQLFKRVPIRGGGL
ncbi:hypothetical protein CORC01_14265 [Colletotrichum orchidophilum]|uniref:Beta-lactamase-related domain-containing protein n=1 Tax=Colletotrichum orchidophilum TaxID=1209926 RepID=A0A1G4AMP7_9PEZI|nr:uncharacterized protein CORC01_14265 [Colletotrichum orchidophilum]OHE90437.1 hypothetical protein CORC01_14265 [Colletotrichum orchidophilum]